MQNALDRGSLGRLVDLAEQTCEGRPAAVSADTGFLPCRQTGWVVEDVEALEHQVDLLVPGAFV